MVLPKNDRRCWAEVFVEIEGDTPTSENHGSQQPCLRAEAIATASGLGKEIKINISENPFLTISWKVERGIKGFLETTKQGHDFPARVMLIKKTGFLPWQRETINYVFSSSSEVNQHWISPHSSRSYIYVASSLADSDESEWITAKINVREHFKDFFSAEYDYIDGIAIMTDADNTKNHAIAYYGSIYFSN